MVVTCIYSCWWHHLFSVCITIAITSYDWFRCWFELGLDVWMQL